jgi:hypothetical protein
MSWQIGSLSYVIPAQAGIQGKRRAFLLGPRFRGDDGKCFTLLGFRFNPC